MQSITKNKQNKETIEKMIHKFFAPMYITEYKELTEGFFNVAYEVHLSDDSTVILKIAPNKGMRIMTYERNIMFSEVNAMRMAREYGGIPVPMVLGADDSGSICASSYFFMEQLAGNSLHSQKNMITNQQLESIYKYIGKINHRINEIVCPCFGYPGQPEYQGNEWYPIFRKMLIAGIMDAKRGNVDLKISVDTLLECLNRDRDIFLEVTQPRLVHWDCWDGNIFVKDGTVTGLIDWERSIWGDPLMEVGFRTYDENPYFNEGYGIAEFTEHQWRRAIWYDIYLLLLMSLECEYRGYETMDLYDWATECLVRQFQKIK